MGPSFTSCAAVAKEVSMVAKRYSAQTKSEVNERRLTVYPY